MQRLQRSMKEAQKAHQELKQSLADSRRHQLPPKTQDRLEKILGGHTRRRLHRETTITVPLEMRLNRMKKDLQALHVFPRDAAVSRSNTNLT